MSVTAPDGTCVVVDPFPADFGYKPPTVEAQVCLVTHEHRDHNAVDALRGDPVVLRGPGRHQAAGLEFLGIATYHDDQQGAKRGPNTVFVWTMGGMRLAHLGDLGHPLTAQQREQVGPVDVLMIPVGGFYTLEPAEAVEVAKALATKVVLPMHYKTPALERLPIATAEDFLGLIPAEWKVERPDACVLNLREDDLPAGGTRVVLLAYE